MKWMTNPTLTPGHDFVCRDDAVGQWVGCGWAVREDQSDPPLELDIEPAAPVVDEPPVDAPVEPAADQPVDPAPPVSDSAPIDSTDTTPKES